MDDLFNSSGDNPEFIFTSNGEIEQWILPVINISVQKRLSSNGIIMANVDQLEYYTDAISHDMVLALSARICNRDLAQIQYPENWWESVKERWAPKWYLKKNPVKYTVWNAKVFYPGIKIPDHQEFVQFYRKGEHY